MQITCSHCRHQVIPEDHTCPRCRGDMTGDEMSWRLGFPIYIAGIIMGAVFGCWIGNIATGAVGGMVLGGIVGAACGEMRRSGYDKRTRAQRWAHAEEQARKREQLAAVPAGTAYTVADTLDFAALARIQEAHLLASGDYRKCPHCAEVIKAEATLCRFCQQVVGGAQARL